MFISTMAFGLYEAKTLFDYGSCAFVCITELSCLHEYLLHYFAIVDLLDWIKKIDDLIEKSMATGTGTEMKTHMRFCYFIFYSFKLFYRYIPVQ